MAAKMWNTLNVILAVFARQKIINKNTLEWDLWLSFPPVNLLNKCTGHYAPYSNGMTLSISAFLTHADSSFLQGKITVLKALIMKRFLK